MNFDEQTQLVTQPEFIHKVRQAIILEAYNVHKEDTTADADYDAKRLNLAVQILRDPHKWARIMAYGFVLYPQLNGSSSDTVFGNAASTIWDAYAGNREP